MFIVETYHKGAEEINMKIFGNVNFKFSNISLSVQTYNLWILQYVADFVQKSNQIVCIANMIKDMPSKLFPWLNYK